MWNVQRISDEKGFGLVAAQDIKDGCVILEENPIISCQFSWNKLYKYLACDYCMKPLESAENLCKRLLQNESVCLPHLECCTAELLNRSCCESCKAQYCSVECREVAWQEYHEVLCPSSGQVNAEAISNLDETWRNFHFPPETSTIMLIVRIIAKIKQEARNGYAKFRELIEQFCHRCKDHSGKLVHKLLGDEYQDQLCVLREQLKCAIFEESVAHWYTVEGFQSLFALLGANQQGVGSSSLSVWAKNCDELQLPSDERKALDHFIDGLYEHLDEVAGVFLNCEGSGLYEIQSKCNHSCTPNAEVNFFDNSHRLTLKALRDISSGEEITISYLSECELERSRYSRQKILKENYLFVCVCDKCRYQADEPDCTSSEDDSDMITD